MDQANACPKCHYVRRDLESTPAWQCPRCGIAYDKYTAQRAAPVADNADIRPTATKNTARRRFKTIRVTILLLVFVLIGTDALLSKLRSTSWEHPLRVVVYPINADGSAAAAKYLERLEAARFDGIEQLAKVEATRYGINISEPVNIVLAEPIAEIPPLPPRNGNPLQVMWWSLQLRLWAYRVDHYDGPRPQVRAFALYYDPETHPVLAHSTGLEKGMIGIIHLFAAEDMTGQNNMVMFHELLHTLGATDKYDLQTNQPLYPDGYAEPELQPQLPQRKAEVMGGRIPLSRTRADIPERLDLVVVGTQTAREIGWIE